VAISAPQNASWTVAAVEAERQAVDGALTSALTPNAGKAEVRASLDWCLEQLLGGNAGDLSFIRRFFAALAALRLHATHGGLTVAQQQKIVELAHTLLTLSGIKPTTSRVSYLYAELHETQSGVAARDGQHWQALIGFHRAQVLSRKAAGTSRGRQLFSTGSRLLRLGHAASALDMLEMAATDLPDDPAVQLELGRAQRFLGRFVEAKAHFAPELFTAERFARARMIANSSPGAAAPEGDVCVALDAEWEILWTDLVGTGDFQPMAVAIRSDRARRLAPFHLDAWLWLRGHSHPDAFDKLLPGCAQIRKNHLKSDIGRLPDAAAYEAAQIIEELHDTERPLEQRLAQLAPLPDLARRCATFDRCLSIYAAIARWLVRFNQMDLAVCFLAEYKALSRQATGGANEDHLKLLGDLSATKLLGRYRRQSAPPVASADSFTQGRLAHFTDLSLLAVQIGGLMVKGTLTRMFQSSNSRDELKVRTDSEIASVIASFLSKRKGVMLKLGQVCSHFEGPIAAHIAAHFEVLQANVAAMPTAMARQVFYQEFQRNPEEVFLHFCPTPFAAGSIGQVHRATLHDGRAVVVKIQYPMARQLIDFEMRVARLGRRLFARLLPAMDYEGIVSEVEARLLDETDYLAEAAYQEEFRKTFADDPTVIIPAVVKEWSSRRVVTSEFIDGQDFQSFVAHAPQVDRDSAAATMMRVALRSNYGHGMLNGDPQPGNYLFVDGRVAFVDFGCVKRFAPEAAAARLELHRALFRGERDKVVEAYVRAGFVKDGAPVDPDHVFQLFATVDEFALKDEPYEFQSDYASKVFKRFTDDNPHRERFAVPPEFFFSTRIELGLSSVLAAMHARVNYRRILMAVLFPDEPWPEPEKFAVPDDGKAA
jgi:predicted unusual protein kinase regulating ubiquinone biosynthesis (AarF/ABC1/UbiB family)